MGMANSKQTETYSVPDAGRRLGLGRNAAYDAVRRGELPVLRFGRKLVVPRIAFERMLAEARQLPMSKAD